MYSIILKDYICNEAREVAQFHYKSDCLQAIEDFIYDYLLSQQGSSDPVYYTITDLNKLPSDRFYAIKHNRLMYYYSVFYKKSMPGLFKYPKIDKVFDIFMVKNMNVPFDEVVPNFYDDYVNFEKYSMVVKQLNKRFNKNFDMVDGYLDS